MKSIFFYLFIVPIAILLVVFAVINRDLVTVVLDPFSPQDPTLALSIPLYVLVFGSLVTGVIIGGVADWFRQGRYRKAARENRYEAAKWKSEATKMQQQQPARPGLSLPGPQSS
ncbi:MAG: DUF1049 domain-containing protein [Pseudomonadota bacterium]